MQARDGKPLLRHQFEALLIQLGAEHGIKVLEGLWGKDHKRVRWCTETLRRL